MSMFKKRNRKNIRTRQANDEERDDEEQTVAQQTATPTIIKKINQPAAASKVPIGILSFDDELSDGDGFKVKKTSLSERMAKKRDKEKNVTNRHYKLKEDSSVKEVEEIDDDDDNEEEGCVASINDHLLSGMMPDAAVIHAIRKKRERARELGVPSVDYLPLEKDGKKGYGKAKGKSRLIREDEHDKSDDDDDDRIMNFGKTNEPGRQLQVLASLENMGSDSEDEETKRWEEEQINKGIKASNQLQDQSVVDNSAHHYQSMDTISQSFVYDSYKHEADYNANDKRGVVLQHPVIPKNLVPITLETLKSKLTNRLEELKDTNRRHCQQIEQITKDIAVANGVIDKVDSNLPTMEGQYAFFQQMRSYVRDLLSCLAIKNPHVKALDIQMMDVRCKKTKLLIERRQKDVIDEAEECASNGKGINIGPEVEARQHRSVEREARRRRRRERRQRDGLIDHNEGMSSDDELLEANRLKFVSDTDLINEKLKEVFTDVMEDFYRLYVIKTRFEQWKFSYPDTYNQAFVTMCLPKLFSPFVTLQLVNWNPLEPSSPSLQSMKWFQVLIFYGYKEGEAPVVSDNDNFLIPSIVNKFVIPKLTSIVETVWDPLSSRQTKNLIKITNEILHDYCTDPTPQQDDLLMGVNKRLQQAVNNDVFIPLMSSIQLQNTNTHDYLFYQRQFWSAMKLLSNIILWREILPRLVLQQLTIDGLISRYLLLSLQNSPTDKITVKKTELLFSLLPPEWFDVLTVSKSRPLQSLKRYLSNLKDTLERDGMGYGEHVKKINKGLQERVEVIQSVF